MKILLRNSIAFLLIFTMIFTLGVGSFTDNVDINSEPLEIFSGDDKTVTEDVYGEEDIGIGGGGNIGDIDIVGGGGVSTVTGDVYGGPTTGALTYTIKYYLDEVEQMEWEINDAEVSIDNSEVTVDDIPVPADLPEGYVIDEENSTLPFTVTEDENVIMVYYEAITEGEEMTLFFEFDGVRVEVSGRLPLGTQLRLDPISETDMDIYLNAIDQQTDILMGYATLFDISLLDAEGNIIQPNDEVRVSFYGLNHIKADDDVFVYHVKENNVEQDYVEQTNIVAGRNSLMSANHVEIEGFDAIVESGKVSFDTNHFSIYVVGTGAEHDKPNNRYQMNVGDTVNLEEKGLSSGGSWSVQNNRVVLSNTSTGRRNIKATVSALAEGDTSVRYTESGWFGSTSNFHIKVNPAGLDPIQHPTGPYPAQPIIEPGEVNTKKSAVVVSRMVNTWDVTVRIEAEDTKQTSDIVLVIDTSNSMNEGDRLGSAKNAAKQFINELLPNGNTTNRIAIVEFASNLYYEIGFTGASGRQTLLSAIDNLKADHGQDGGTFTQAAVRRAQQLITQSATATHKNIVLLSDGQPTFSYGLSSPNDYLSNQYVGKASTTGSSTTDVNSIRQATTSLAPSSAYTSNRVGTGYAMFHRYSQSPDRFYNHGNSSIAESHFSKLTGTIVYTIAFEAGDLGTPVLNAMASQGKAYTATQSNLSEIFAQIAGGISSTIQSGTLTDVMGDGFEIPAGNVAEISASQGTATYNAVSKTLNWDLGGLILGANRVDDKPTYRYAEITYRVEINDEMIALNLVGGEDALHPTNKSIEFKYEDPNGAEEIITDLTHGQGLTSPQVNPVLLKIKKILPSPMEEENRIFNVEISKVAPNGFNHTEGLVPNADYVWLTTLRHEGTYTVSETGITGNGVTDLGKFEIFYNIDETSQQSFQVDHIDGKPRGDVAIEVTNKQFGEDTPSDKPLIRVSKTFVGLTQAQINQLTDFKIKITSSSDSSMTRDLLLSEGTRYDEANGDITYKWEIKGWPAGTYIIDETGEELTNYTVEIEYYPLGGGNSGQVTTVPPTVNLLKDIVRWTSVKAAGIYNLKYSDGAIPNLIVVKLTGNAGAFIWSDIQYSEPQRQAIVSYLQSEANYLNVEMNKTFWYSNDSFYHRGEFKYNINNGDLTIPASNQWSQIAYLGYEFEGGYSADIAVKNTYTLQTTDVTIKKEVTGNFGDLTRQFAFNVIAKKGKENQQTFDFDLSNGQTETLKNIPKNATLILTEESGTYAVTVKVGGSNIVANQDGSYTIDLANYESGITISVTNHKDVVIDTGITFDTLPYILILSLATIGLGTTVVRKKNIRKED